MWSVANSSRTWWIITYFVSKHDDARLATEVLIDIFQSTSSGFRIQEIREWNEEAIQDRPDNIELPLQILDANLCDLDNHAEQMLAECSSSERKSQTHKLKIQFVAVPSAAPLALIARPLISVGYSHGTPWKPIPKKT